MDQPTIEQYEKRLAELASFCFHKLANLESRFIILCHRAKVVGIDCDDLCNGYVVAEDNSTEPLRILN
jgi:hypothetical protein